MHLKCAVWLHYMKDSKVQWNRARSISYTCFAHLVSGKLCATGSGELSGELYSSFALHGITPWCSSRTKLHNSIFSSLNFLLEFPITPEPNSMAGNGQTEEPWNYSSAELLERTTPVRPRSYLDHFCLAVKLFSCDSLIVGWSNMLCYSTLGTILSERCKSLKSARVNEWKCLWFSRHALQVKLIHTDKVTFNRIMSVWFLHRSHNVFTRVHV